MEDDSYESRRRLNQYLLAHYGSREEIGGNLPTEAYRFAQRCVELLGRAAQTQGRPRRALDLGCAVGGATFELTRSFDAVIGVDLSASFIAAARQLKSAGRIECVRRDEAELETELMLSLDPSLDRRRVEFLVGDAAELSADLGRFDGILVANLLCRLPRPRACMAQLRDHLVPGGRLLVTSPYSWLGRHTERPEWLGGRDGVRSHDGLCVALEPDFTLEERCDIPFVLREHARRFEYIVADATLWRRRA